MGNKHLSEYFRIVVNLILYNRVSTKKMIYWYIYIYIEDLGGIGLVIVEMLIELCNTHIVLTLRVVRLRVRSI